MFSQKEDMPSGRRWDRRKDRRLIGRGTCRIWEEI